jgi:hypothetical protein
MANLTRWKRQLKSSLLVNSIFCEVLAPAVIEDACRQAGHVWRESFWSPTITLFTFLLQVLSAEKTLRAAVTSLLTQLLASGEMDLPSADPTAYCQARQRLPAKLFAGLLGRVTDRMQQLPVTQQTWRGHRVWVNDGACVSMPDEPELQKAFPQPEAQMPGCGFPVARLVVVFCWATGAIVDLMVSSLHHHEITLFRKLWHHFRPGDVVINDRAYCSYTDIVQLLQRGVSVVCRLHRRRKADFRTGTRLGKDDQRVTWERPRQWFPTFGVTQQEFQRLPETMTVRIIRISHVPRGFRSRPIDVVTTLLDPMDAPADEIRQLYRDRWTAELNIRSLKTQLGMDVLRGKSTDVVSKEIVMHLVAYNLIRLLMWHAAAEYDRPLHRLSFTGTLHRFRNIYTSLLRKITSSQTGRLLEWLLRWIAQDQVPDRPNRIEPRRKKRRPKEYSLLSKPRAWYKYHRDLTAR